MPPKLEYAKPKTTKGEQVIAMKLLLTVIALTALASCQDAMAPTPAGPCETAETGPESRTLQIESLGGCTITTEIGTSIVYRFESPYDDVRISWNPPGTSRSGVNAGRVLTVSGTVTGSPQKKKVRLWYGTRSTTFTWKVVDSTRQRAARR
jgi:hypothetical protein